MGVLSASDRRYGASDPVSRFARGTHCLRIDVPGTELPAMCGADHRHENVPAGTPEGRQLFVLANLIAALNAERAPHYASLLLDRFGSLGGVLDAPDDAISRVLNDGGVIAHLLRFAKETVQERHTEQIGGRPVSHKNDAFLRFVVTELGNLREEALLAVFLDHADRFVGKEIVARGSRIELTFETRKLLRSAVERNAFGLIIAHNHPSGQCRPSAADITATVAAKNAAQQLGIRLADHLIVAGPTVYSMKRGGQL